MIRYAHIVLTILFLLSVNNTSTFSQYDDIKFEHLTIADGIPGNSVWCILQDHLGYVWLGTRNGLVKYDGYTMRVYQPIPNDSTSISSRATRVLYEDKSGNLWIGASWQSEGGLNLFNRATETFTRYLHNPNDSNSLSSNPVYSIYEDKEGRLWIGTSNGLNLFDPKLNGFVHHYIKDSESLKDFILAITENPITGNLLIGSSLPGLWEFDVSAKKFSKYDFNNVNQAFNSASIISFFTARDFSVWMSTSRGLGHFYPRNNHLNFYQIIPTAEYTTTNQFNSLIEGHTGQIWIGTYGGGLAKFDPLKESFQRFRHNEYDNGSLGGDHMMFLFEDNSGILWIGTNWWGLNKWDRKKHKFKHYSKNLRNLGSLSTNWVRSICEDNAGRIWIGTSNGGLNWFNRDDNKFQHFKHNPKDPYSISGDDIFFIIKDTIEKDIIWVGTNGDGLNKFNTKTLKFTYYLKNPDDPNSISGDSIRSLLVDSRGLLWVGTRYAGLNKFDRQTGKFTRYQSNPNDPNSISHNTVNVIYEDTEGVLWIGTDEGGICQFDRNTNKFTTYRSLAEDQNASIIMFIYEDKKRNFWVGTYKTGIHLFDRVKGISIRNYTENDGLANNLVCAILEDDSGNLWISTGNGLSKFNPATETFRNYGISDGLAGSFFNYRSAYKNEKGEMFFGSDSGLNVFYPDSIKDDPIPPQVQIANISLFNKPGERLIFDGFISELNEIKLSYDQNDLRFDYVGLHFSEPTRNTYKYILEGFDEEWVDAGTQRNAVYTNLDPGEYVFKVKAANRDGVWNEEGASINLIISPPFWATTWAYIIYVILILTVIYFTWKLQLKRIIIKHDYEMSKFEAEKMHEVDELKSRFFANISHEFRTPLTLIFGPAKDISEKTKEQDTKKGIGIIKRNATRLYGLVNQLLDLSKLESGKMRLEASRQDIIPLVKGIFLSFTSFAERKKITLKFNTIEENLKVYIDRDKVEKIINNLLSNAFKFTPEGGRIDFSVKKLVNDLEIKITDNGIGIPEERIDKIFDRFYQVDSSHTRQGEGTGIGLALTKELVELHKGKIYVQSIEGEGTTVMVQLPLGKDHLKPEEIVEKGIQEKAPQVVEEIEFISETNNGKDKTEIDALLEMEKPLLLIVEDNSDVRSYIISHLEEDYRIQEAVDGEEGHNQAINNIPDLVISDVMMPKMDGFELCNKLKSDERTSHIPIIMLTAKATSKDKIEGYETGADDYIMKPFDATELKARIKNLIEIRRKLQEKFSDNDYNIPKELCEVDEKFIKKVFKVINEHISEEKFSVEELRKETYMSTRHLQRKVIALTGKSPIQLIRSIRLYNARKQIKEQKGTIAEIAYNLGFSSPAYFTKCFKDEFGYSPTDLIK